MVEPCLEQDWRQKQANGRNLIVILRRHDVGVTCGRQLLELVNDLLHSIKHTQSQLGLRIEVVSTGVVGLYGAMWKGVGLCGAIDNMGLLHGTEHIRAPGETPICMQRSNIQDCAENNPRSQLPVPAWSLPWLVHSEKETLNQVD